VPESGSGGAARPVPVHLFIEFNATDGDAALQASFDGQAWTRVRIVAPTGRTVFERSDPAGVLGVDLTEFVPESQEPTLPQLFQMFPPGDYLFSGTTVRGERREGMGKLSHDLPDPAVIVAIDPNVPVITWTWSAGQRSPIRELAGFLVILEDGREVTMSFDLHPSTTS